MCYFLTELIPESIDPKVFDECFKPLGLKLKPIDNPAIMAQVGPGFEYYFGTEAECDCDTMIGRITGIPRGDEMFSEDIKYAYSATEPGLWIECIKLFLKTTGEARMGLLLHYYDGSLKNEFELDGFIEMQIDELTTETLLNFESDTIYWFMP